MISRVHMFLTGDASLVAVLLMVATSTCEDPSFSLPKKPIDGYCKPGVTYHCPCSGDDASAYASGRQTCGEDYRVSPCACDAGSEEP